MPMSRSLSIQSRKLTPIQLCSEPSDQMVCHKIREVGAVVVMLLFCVLRSTRCSFLDSRPKAPIMGQQRKGVRKSHVSQHVFQTTKRAPIVHHIIMLHYRRPMANMSASVKTSSTWSSKDHRYKDRYHSSINLVATHLPQLYHLSLTFQALSLYSLNHKPPP